MTHIDTLIFADWIIPVEPAQTVLPDHGIAVDQGNIVAIEPADQLRQRFTARHTHLLDQHVLIPGLINLHTHAAMSLMRGLADDLPLMDWLKGHIWPAEQKWVYDDFVNDGTLLACAEMQRAGITCFADMYFFPEAAASACATSGMRAALGMVVIDFPTRYASDPDDYLHHGLALRDAQKDNALLSFCLAPHAPYTVSDAAFGKIATYAAQLDLPIHIHVHETVQEIGDSIAQYGLRPLQRLQNLGLLSPGLLMAHAVHLTDDEVALLAREGVNIAHCPTSNLKLASGIAPIHAMQQAGINIGLGTDGAASNNRMDLLAEMRLAALLAKGSSGFAEALPAHEVLAMATLNGAKALGLAERTGSLQPGKAADIAAINLDTPETHPCFDPLSHIVYAAGREHVSQVWIDGKQVVRDRQPTWTSQADLHALAARWQVRLAQHHLGAGNGER